jgi:hypothetical protein
MEPGAESPEYLGLLVEWLEFHEVLFVAAQFSQRHPLLPKPKKDLRRPSTKKDSWEATI